MKSKWIVPAMALLLIAGVSRAHEHHAPHKGTLIEFGEEFAHLELVLSKDGKLTAYVLDGEAEKAVRVKQKEIEIKISTIEGKEKSTTITLKAAANVLTGETEGDTSEFHGQSDDLKKIKKFEAAITALTVKGKEFKDVKFKFPEGNEEGKDEKKK
jgi:hypothetical protein